MPFTGASDPKLPENVQALPEARREQWVAIWNASHEKCMKDDGSDCEAAAFRQANGVVFDSKSVEIEHPETEKTLEPEPVETKDESLEPETKTVDVEPDSFMVYKQDDGSYRWTSISSVAVKDKEFEIVTEKAQDDAIQHAIDTGEFGELDLVHVDGTDVGDCDLMVRVGKQLIEGGVFYDTEMAKGVISAVQDDPDYWGVSIKFVYDPSKFDGEKYLGNIRIRKRTILPQDMAASFGTKFVAIGGTENMSQISDKAREALEKLNVPEEDIEKLAEKQVDDEPNTVEKEAEVETVEPETVEVEKNLWERIKAAFSKPEVEKAEAADAETGGEETTEVEPVEAEETKEVDLTETVKGMFDAYTEATVEAFVGALGQRDEQIATLGEAVLTLSEQIKELQQPIDVRIEKRLAELPKIVKAAPSQVASIETPTGPTLPYQNQTPNGNFVGELMKSVEAELAAKTRTNQGAVI